MNRQIFFVTSGRIAVYQWQGGQFANPLVFMADEEGLTQFSLYLEHTPKDTVYMLVDFVEEEFREDTIPHVLGPDRRALIRTKLNRLFRNPTYSHAIVQGRQTDGRRDDQMLFTALIRPDLLAPWVGQMAKHKIPVAGIYSLPLISDQLLKTLRVDSNHALLVSLQSAGGLRQTFFQDQRVKLSRLAMMPQVQEKGYASYVLGEVEKIRRYLNSLRMLPHDSPLDVYVLGDADLLAEMGRQSPDSITTRHHLHDLGDVARSLGIKGVYSSRYADRIFAHLLARKPVPNQYAPASQTKYHVLYRTRSGLRAVSLTLLLGSALWGGLKFVEGVSAAGEADSVREQVTFYNERYRLARTRLPKTPVDSHDIKQAVELAAKMVDYKAWPYPMMAALSDGMRPFPGIKLEKIEWKAGNDASAQVGATKLASKSRGIIRSLLGPAKNAQNEKSSIGNVYQLASIKGRVDPFTGDYRAALEMVRSFAEVLRGLARVQDVQVLALPLDIGSGNSLSGDASTEGVSSEAPFEIRVVFMERDVESG